MGHGNPVYNEHQYWIVSITQEFKQLLRRGIPVIWIINDMHRSFGFSQPLDRGFDRSREHT